MPTPRDHRFTVAIVLVTLALVAFFLAQGAMGLVGRKLAGDGPAEDGAKSFSSRAVMPPVRERRDATAMLQRNIFDSQSGDLTRPKEVPADPEAVAVDENAPPGRCENGTRLVAAMVHATKPELSFAAIADTSGKTMLYRVGQDVAGMRVAGIDVARVLLAPTGGRRCELSMFSAGVPVAIAAPTVAPPPVVTSDDDMASGMASGSRIPPEEIEQGVTRISDTKFNITRNLVSKLLENQGEIMRSARIIPHEEDGRVVGVKLYGIRRQSLLGQLGLQNGDMLRTINGYDMTSPDKALEAYSRLQTATSITVSAVRRGSPVAIDYNITE